MYLKKYHKDKIYFDLILISRSIAGPARSKAWVCGRWLPGIVGLNPAEGMQVCLLCVVKSLSQADHSSRGVLPNVCVCVSECDREASKMGSSWPKRGFCEKKVN